MDIKPALYKGVTRVLARTLRSPQYLILFVSDACWMKCRHCWFNEDWKEKHLVHKAHPNQIPVISDNEQLIKTRKVDYDPLTFDELEKMATSMPRLTFLSLTGGEAFIRRDIVDIVDMFSKKTKLGRYQIPTSGFVTDMIVEKAERMLKRVPNIPFRVDVSLDGTEKTHEHVRNVAGAFDRALETIRELNKLAKKYPHFDVGVITTISQYNQNEIDEIAEIALEANQQREWMVNITRGEPRDPTSINVDPDKYLHAHNIIEQKIAGDNFVGHSGHAAGSWLSAKNAVRRQIIHDTITEKQPGGGCSAGALSAVIYSDGEVYPCELLEQSFGNIRDFDYNLPRLFNSVKSDEIRAWIQDNRCICTQECFLSMNLLIQPQHWPALLRERIRIGRSSRVASLKKCPGPT